MSKAVDVLKKMTLEQKIAQMQCAMAFGGGVDTTQWPDGLGEVGLMNAETKEQLAEAIHTTAEAIAANANGVRPSFHVETLTGVSMAEATVFPSAIGLGATFDPELVEKAAEIIHNQAKAAGYDHALSPVLDICRDPRWGRIGETYGEDPTLSAMIGTAFVKALQGPKDDFFCATGKHFLGYGMSSGGINMATCTVPQRELREVYAKPFQAAITEGGLMSVMNSYGTIDGEMVVGSQHILTDLLRGEMEFEGEVISDYASIEHLVDHRLAKDMAEGGIQAIKAGLDIECPIPSGYRTDYIKDALQKGLLTEEDIDRAALRILKTKERMGLFAEEPVDPVRLATAFTDPQNDVCNLEVARKSVVLLKNDGILPLKKNAQKIAVIGPHADSIRLVFGCYTLAAGMDMMIGGSLADQAGMETSMDDLSNSFAIQKDVPKYKNSTVERDHPAVAPAVAAIYPKTKTVLSAIRKKVPQAEVTYAKGCEVAGDDRVGFAEAIERAKCADVAILTLGGKYGWGGSCTIGEGVDTDDIGLTGVQEELALRIIETGTPVIIVHMDARPFANPRLAEAANAILENWFPGTTGGLAIADVLFGDYNPAGRLPTTAPRSVGQVPVYHSQPIGNSYYIGVCQSSSARYVDSTPEPLYYFGHGLSYTQFAYRDLSVEKTCIRHDETTTISCYVKNVGKYDGEEVVQLYIADLESSMLRPYHEFAGCKRVFLKVGEEKKVSFIVRADQFAFIDKENQWIVEAGDMQVAIGGASNNLPLQGMFRIENTEKIRPAKRGFYAKTVIGE